MSDDTRDDEAGSQQEPDAKTKQPPGKRHLKAAKGSQIYATDPIKRDIVYLAREFILCTLPHSDPGDVLSWSRTNGHLTLGIVAGINIKTGKSYGLPYGIIPRLLLVWIVTEIIRTKSRYLELGHTLSEFLLKLGLDPSRGGARSDARRVREQMERLFHASIHFLGVLKDENRSGLAWDEGMKIAPKGALWWSEREPDQGALWGSWIEIGEEFFRAVMRAPCPLDVRVLRHIKDSSLGIDLYTILNREAFLAHQEDKPRFLAWEWLYEQTGNEYTGEDGLKNFRRKAIEQVEAILAVHSGLIISIVKGRKGQKSGLLISNLSRPSIPPEEPERMPQLIEAASRTPPDLMLVKPDPTPERRLSPASLDKFRALYPNLDPYACKAAFDAWIAEKRAEREPKHYDKAFLGFAAKWARGKL